MAEGAEIDVFAVEAVQLAQKQRIFIQSFIDLAKHLLQLPRLLLGAHIDDLSSPRRHIGDDAASAIIQLPAHLLSPLRLKEHRVARISAKQHLPLKELIQLIRGADLLPGVSIGHDEHIAEQEAALLVGCDIRVFHEVKAQRLQRRAMPRPETALIGPFAKQRVKRDIAEEILRAGKRLEICRRFPYDEALCLHPILAAALPHPFLIVRQTHDLQAQRRQLLAGADAPGHRKQIAA